jgi:hypothetical protein
MTVSGERSVPALPVIAYISREDKYLPGIGS